MAQDKVKLYNLALSAAGSRELVSSPTEKSRAAETCDLWFETVRDHVLKSAPWPSAKAVSRLALGDAKSTDTWQEGDADPGYLYAYNAPQDMLQPRFLAGYQRFEIGVRVNTISVMTNQEQALLVYTKRQDNIALWDSSLFLAISMALASYITMPLTGKNQRSALARENANQAIAAARVSQANTDSFMHDHVPEWIQARGFIGSLPVERFIYPYAPLLSADTA